MTESNENQSPGWFTPWRFGVLLALLVFAAFPQVLSGTATFVARDYGFFAYPLAGFQKECFAQGTLPFWNPYNNCGVPFLAQWNTMPLYPPAILYLALPLPWSLGFFGLLHLWFAGMGMYFLARRWTGNEFAAAFAGTVFAFNGFTLNLLMWPSHLATFSWLPWVILATDCAWRGSWRNVLLAALAGTLQMLAGGPEIIFLTWLIVVTVWVQQFGRADAPRVAMCWRFPVIVLLVMAASAAQLLPFLDLVHHAQRASGFADLRWSMTRPGWTNFLVPMAFGTTLTEGIFFEDGQYWTSSFYVGIGTLWLALMAGYAMKNVTGAKSKVWMLWGIAVTGLILSLGEHTPVLPLLRKMIPQLSLITYPIKYISVAIFALPLLAAFALANISNLKKRIVWPGIVLVVAIIGILVWAHESPVAGSDSNVVAMNGISRILFLVLSGSLLILLANNSRSALMRVAPLVLVLVAWTDVYTHEPPQNPTVPNWVVQPKVTRDKLSLDPQPGLQDSRAMVSPAAALKLVNSSASKPQDNFLAKRMGYCGNCNLLDGVPKVDGFFSLTPFENDEVLSRFYSTGDASYPGLENFMGVSQITAPDELFHWQARPDYHPLVTAGQRAIFADDKTALAGLTSPEFDGNAVVYLSPEARLGVTVTNQTVARVVDYHIGNSAMTAEVAADAPSLVVFAETYYHNWRAEVDGAATPIFRANVAFQAVPVPAGKHSIRLTYEDQAFRIGAWISAGAWLVILGGVLLGMKKVQ